ncbi:MAG TPA: oxygen-independent coproporphyrinogen III oxidase [Aquabacterium sp.]|uniref:oxygen-independent coproporphyrinogen III oxidase n=1 Tax=Aquabacterium sp. TaxID=1872578 RepID=UPI002E369110|nr:oxygen-independent coproporphyrinogen III oxidase [Aquabacterium sp.]HEX5372870.1 oxygen-independent coproporphyrinogen III oxidase [Aquabacterium sp.]
MNAQALSASSSSAPLVITRDMIARLDVAGPRYTSYPTADRFVEAFGAPQYRQALAQRAHGAGAVGGGAQPLSVYVHIPFCESVCYYCACNKVVTRHHERAIEYLEALYREIDLHVEVLGRGQSLSQLHLGGGTPTFLTDEQIEQLLNKLQSAFRFVPGGEYSIEIDPRTVDAERLGRLWAMGFNRISLGVQDFDPQVQQAVHRVQSFESVAGLMDAARKVGFESINMDLIYGLPRQTSESFARTLAQVTQLRPERVALYAYAHLPQRFKPQRRIDAKLLPPPVDKIGMLSAAIEHFREAGYDYIGMDHFALPSDPLAVAKRQGRLHRNFQGYSTQPDSDLIGLGVSAIGRIGPHYTQNAKTLDEYYDTLGRGEFPIVRGLTLSRDDLVRRAVIMAIMCQGRVDIESIELAYLIDFRQYFAQEIEQLEPLVEKGLVVMEPDGVRVSPLGWYFVRAIAMVFDRHLQADKVVERFSRII